VFIFHVDVTRIKKFPIVKQFAVKPWMYDLAFTTDKVMKEGTLDKSMCPGKLRWVETRKRTHILQMLMKKKMLGLQKKLKVGENNTSDNNSPKSGEKNSEFPIMIL
jgi:hypothetical protein